MRMVKGFVIVFMSTLILSGCAGTNNYYIKSGENTKIVNKKVAEDTVFFDYDSSKLSPESKVLLDKQVEWLNSYKGIKANIEGHCDERGTDDYNLALGERRADTIKDYLIAKGIDGNTLDIISYGRSKPAVNGHDEEAWKYNRRGVTSIKN